MEDLFTVEGVKLEKSTLPKWRERVAIDLVEGQGESHRFYVKRFSRGGRRSVLGSIFKGGRGSSPARIERDWILRLTESGIAVPKVAAFGEASGGRSALVLEEVLGESLERWVLDRKERAPRALIEAVADLARAFHRLGYIHRDFYLSHIFASGADSAAPKLAIIDLQRVMHRPIRFWRWRNRDLAQLDYSVPEHVAGPRERVRFLRRYLGVRFLRADRHRRVIRAIRRKSLQIAQHDRRRQARSKKAGAP